MLKTKIKLFNENEKLGVFKKNVDETTFGFGRMIKLQYSTWCMQYVQDKWLHCMERPQTLFCERRCGAKIKMIVLFYPDTRFGCLSVYFQCSLTFTEWVCLLALVIRLDYFYPLMSCLIMDYQTNPQYFLKCLI